MTTRATLRDHERVRAERDGPVRLEQYQCTVCCGSWFLLAASFHRHRTAEAEALVPAAAAKQAAYAQKRRLRRENIPFTTREAIASAEESR